MRNLGTYKARKVVSEMKGCRNIYCVLHAIQFVLLRCEFEVKQVLLKCVALTC